jgi:hypothetical protein
MRHMLGRSAAARQGGTGVTLERGPILIVLVHAAGRDDELEWLLAAWAWQAPSPARLPVITELLHAPKAKLVAAVQHHRIGGQLFEADRTWTDRALANVRIFICFIHLFVCVCIPTVVGGLLISARRPRSVAKAMDQVYVIIHGHVPIPRRLHRVVNFGWLGGMFDVGRRSQARQR